MVLYGATSARGEAEEWELIFGLEVSQKRLLLVVPPNVINWFINPMNTIDISPTKTIVIGVINQLNAIYILDISPINHSYWSYKPT